MKTIFYIVLVCIALTIPGLPVRQTGRIMVLHPSAQDVSIEVLKQSADIISSRLRIFAPGSSVSLNPGKKIISVRIPANAVPDEITRLLTTKGSVGFFEILTAGELAAIAKSGPVSDPSEGRLACTGEETQHYTDSLRAILESGRLLYEYRLIWGAAPGNSGSCLYAVRKDPSLTGADLESVTSSYDEVTQSASVSVRFRSLSAASWAELTRENLGKPLAIVVDDKVFYAPVVKTAMENGLCEITGSFKDKEVRYFAALAGNDTLPAPLIAR